MKKFAMILLSIVLIGASTVFGDVYEQDYEIVSYHNDLCAVYDDGYLYSLTDIEGNTLIDFKYDELDIIKNDSGLVIATYVDQKGVIDRNDNEIIPFEYNDIECWDDNRIFAYSRDTEKIDIFDMNGKQITSIESVNMAGARCVYPAFNGLYYYTNIILKQ